MKVKYGPAEVQAASKLGLKPLVARFLLLRPVNFVLRGLARALLPDRIGQRLPLGVREVEFRPVSAGIFTLLDPHRDLHARDIFWGGGRPTNPADARVLRCVEKLCSSASTFADVGSFAGLFAILAAKASPSLRSIAYEIAPENYLLLVRNVINNDLVARVDCRFLGLARQCGSMRIPGALGLSSNPTSISIGSSFEEGVEIPLSTLDVESGDWNGPLVMKIDVEGFELDVLCGGREMLARLKPDLICEVLPGPDDGSCEQIEQLLRPLGYRIFQSVAEGFVERNKLVPTSEGHDWLFSARPDIDEIIRECA